ncbi:hypothetical protein LEMLEM_LOCUS17440, partial [Lemmus lemmus]
KKKRGGFDWSRCGRRRRRRRTAPAPFPSASSKAGAAEWPWPWLDRASQAAGPDDPRGNPGPRDPAPVTASLAGPRSLGPARQRRQQEAGSPGPLCVQGGGGVAGSPRPRGPRPFPRGGARRLPHPCLAARGRSLLPTPPGPALGSYRKGITIPSPPTRHLALSPPPPVTSSSSPVGPSASLHSPPQFAHFRPPSASPCRSAASGVLFFPPLGRSW